VKGVRKDTGKGRGGSLPSSGLPLLGSSDRQLQEKEFASPAERKKAATLEKAAARKVQTAAAKKEEQLRSASLTLAARRSDADSIGRLLVPVVKRACTEALEQRPVEHPEPTSIMIPGIEGFLDKHLLPYGQAINGLIKTAGHLQTMLATASAAHKGAAHLELLKQNSLAPLPQWQKDMGIQMRQLQEGQQALANRYMATLLLDFALLDWPDQRARTFLCR
jgi:hypothetical protein